MSFSRIPPAGVIALPENSYVGNRQSVGFQGEAVNWNEVGTGPTWSRDDFIAALGTGGPGPLGIRDYDSIDPADTDLQNDWRYHWSRDAYNIVTLPDNGVILTEHYDTPRLPPWTMITGNPNKPAVFRPNWDMPNVSGPAMIMFSDHLIIENFLIDYYSAAAPSGNVWIPFRAGLKVVPPGGSEPYTPHAVQDITIRNILFYDSAPLPHKQAEDGSYGIGDNWCFNINTMEEPEGSPGYQRDWYINKDITIEYCTSLREFTQFTSGGYGGGLEGITVRNCYCDKPNAGGIQFTNATRTDPEDPAPLKNFIIENNVIDRATGGGIYVGYDGHPDPEPLFWEVAVENIKIRNNLITYGGFGDQFGVAIHLRPNGSQDCIGCEITSNTVLTSVANAAGKNPDGILLTFSRPTTIKIKDNNLFGNAEIYSNGTVHPTIVNDIQDPWLIARDYTNGWTIGDRLSITTLEDTPPKNNPGNAQADNVLWRMGNQICVNDAYPEYVLKNDAFANNPIHLWRRYVTVDVTTQQGNIPQVDINWVKTDDDITVDYPTDGVLIIHGPPVQEPFTWAVEGGTVYWLGPEPDFTTLPVLTNILVEWRYDGTDVYCAWISASSQVQDDTAPVLGGNLNVNSYNITCPATTDITFQAGGFQGDESVIWKDSLGEDQFTIDSDGLAYFRARVGVGILQPEELFHAYQAGSSGAVKVSSDNWSSLLLESDRDGSAGGPRSFGITTAPNANDTHLQVNGTTELQLGPSKVVINNLPTSDPGASGQLWVDGAAGNVIKMSP